MMEIDPAQFADAHRTEQRQAADARRVAHAAALAGLHAARDAFVEHAADLYADGATAAAEDSDRLEDIADRIRSAVERLEPAFDRLDVARDLALYRSAVLSRSRSRYDPHRLALLMAEALGSELLSGPANAVLVAALSARG